MTNRVRSSTSGGTFPRTLLLAGVGYAFGLLIGITIGIQSAVRRIGASIRHGRAVLIGYAMPTFWLASCCHGVSIHLGWLPTQGMGR